MKRRAVTVASLAVLACSPLVVFAACNGSSATEGPDAAAPDGAPPTTDGSSGGVDVSQGDTGLGGGDTGTADSPTSVTDGASGDAGPDASDSGPQCATLPAANPVVVTGNITTSTTWTCDNVYLVQGVVQVMNPGVDYGSGGVDAGTTATTVLTIQAGTTVLMQKDLNNNGSLLVYPGAQLYAVGTSDSPIVFTSSAVNNGGSGSPGDWGAIGLIGWAPGNFGSGGPDGGAIMQAAAMEANGWYQGNPLTSVQAGSYDPSHDTDSSGTLKYVRMEYGGNVIINLTPDAGPSTASSTMHEMLGLYGAGRGTQLSYLNIRQGLFGCVFAEGGQFRADHVVCQFHGQSGGFDVSRGNQSEAQFIVVQETPTFTSEGIGFKGASATPTGGAVESPPLPPYTTPTVYNVTACGSFGGNSFEDPDAFFMKRAPGGYLANFIGTGYYAGLLMQSDLTDAGVVVPASAQMVSSILWNNFDPYTQDAAANEISDPNTTVPVTSNGTGVPQSDYSDLTDWFANQANNSSTTDPGISAGCQNPTSLKLGPPTSLTTGAATPPNDGFFDPTATYIGAFKDSTDTWATGNWIKWSAQ